MQFTNGAISKKLRSGEKLEAKKRREIRKGNREEEKYLDLNLVAT